MKKNVVLSLLSFSLSASCMAQDLKVVRATVQSTFGGPVLINDPNSHTSYTICLSPIIAGIVFDSLYINNSLALKLHPDNKYVETDIENNKYTIQAIIYAKPKAVKGTVIPVRHFTGAGLVIYTCRGKSYSVPIPNLEHIEMR